MAVVKFLVVLVILNLLLTFTRGDTEVSCVFMETCILPCSFQVGPDVVLHWIQVTAGDLRVHSYYYKQDQLALQDQGFRGRTSLFKDQISRGNASLQLTEVNVQDQGRYKCYTSTIDGFHKESFINLKVDAPVHKVDLEQVENRITCSSEGIYPKPELTWSTGPPSNVTSKYNTTVQQNKLYTISSSLILSDSDADLVYSCTISTRRNWRRVTLRQLPSVNGSDTETTILCTTLDIKSLKGFGLIWRFNHSQIILNKTGANDPYTVSEDWRQQVKAVSESGSLTIQDLSSNLEGVYTCELNNAEETFISNTFLRIENGYGEEASRTSAKTAATVVVVFVLIVAVCVGVCWKHKRAVHRRLNREKWKEMTDEKPHLKRRLEEKPQKKSS